MEWNGMEGEGERNASEKPAPPISDLEETFTPSTVDTIEAVLADLNAVQPAYKATPHLSQIEMTAISQNLRLLSDVTPEQWATLADFRKSAEGSKSAWLFSSRQRLLENISEALQKSADWQERQTSKHLPVNGGRGPGKVIRLKDL